MKIKYNNKIFIEYAEDEFVNLDTINSFYLKPIKEENNDGEFINAYQWMFYGIKGSTYCSFYFETKEEAREWMKKELQNETN